MRVSDEDERAVFRGDVLDALKQRQVEGVQPPDDDADGVDPERTRARGRSRRADGQHDRPDAVSSLHETVGLEPGVRRTHRVHVDAELTGKGADRWQALAGRELPVGDEERDSRTDLRRDSCAGRGIEPER